MTPGRARATDRTAHDRTRLQPRPLSGPFQTAFDSALTPDERRRIARRLGGALAAGVLLVAGLAHRYLVPGQAEITAVLLALGAVVAMAPVLAAGVRGFVTRDPNSAVDQLVSLALLAAAAVGEFETAILVPLVMEIGHFFEERSILGARAAIEGLKTLRPNTAARLELAARKRWTSMTSVRETGSSCGRARRFRRMVGSCGAARPWTRAR